MEISQNFVAFSDYKNFHEKFVDTFQRQCLLFQTGSSNILLVLKCIPLCSFINKIKIVFAMCSENKNFHIVSQIVFAPWSVFRLSKAVACAARRHQLILTAWPSISSSKELEFSDFDGELRTAAAAAFTLSWHRWMNPRSWKKKVIWLIGIFDAVGIFLH